MTAPFVVEVLGESHDRNGFSCGIEAVDHYFRHQVTQDVRRRATLCYVAVESAGGKVAGYYTLAAAGVPLTEIPAPLAKRLPLTRVSRSTGEITFLYLTIKSPRIPAALWAGKEQRY